MAGSDRGQWQRSISRQVWLMLISQAVWMSLLFGFFTWWGLLLHRQAERIADLERQAGVPEVQVVAELEKLERIVFWETGTMFLLVALISFVIIWFFFRDARRTRAVQTFFAGITHELRTPMTGIRLQADSIIEKTGPDDPTRKLACRLVEHAGQLESHLEQVLELARVEGGGEPQLQPVCLREFTDRFIRDWQAAHSNGPQVSAHLDKLACFADPVALASILRNLFENSVKHSGRADVAAVIDSRREGDRVLLTYKDNGNGFDGSPEELAQVFAKGRSSDGSGVGLYLISVLMKQMGGSARFESADGFRAVLEFRSASAGVPA